MAEIDDLRVYLIKHNLFPRNRDPHNSPIRIEELKELVKHWKLHRQRGFWRDHPDKDDLVRALLQHIRSEAASKKRRQEAQEKYRNKTLGAGGDSEAGAKPRDFTMIFGGGGGSTTQEDANDPESGRVGDADKKAVLKKKKNCGGDLFYQRGAYDDGMIYLSRIDRLIYNISLSPDKALQLLDMEIVRILTKMYLAEFSKDIVGSSSNGVEQQLEERVVRDGIVRALLAIVKGYESNGASSVGDEKAMSTNIITSLSNLSKNAKCHEGMLRDGVLDAITVLCKTNPGDPRAPFKGLVGVRGEELCYHCAVVLRNLSRQEPSETQLPPPTIPATQAGTTAAAATSSNATDVKNQRVGSQAGLVQIVLMLSQTTSPETREHVVVTIHNLALNKRCRPQLIKHDAVKVLLRLGTNAATTTKRHICALALQSLSKQDPADDPHVANIIQEGIVSAIATLADQHQHDVLASAASCVNAIVVATTSSSSSASASGGGTNKAAGGGGDICSLNKSDNQSVPQEGAPPDWAKVNICSLAPWQDVENLVESASRQHGDKETHGDSHSDGGNSDAEDANDAQVHNRKSSPSKRLAVASPKIGVRVSVKNSPSSSKVATTAAPRVCNGDAVLGFLEILVDPKMDKIEVNVDAELALRRSAAVGGGASGDELPKLRPVTAPDGGEDLVALDSHDGKPKKHSSSTLTQVRHDATASNRTSVSAAGTSQHRSLSVTTSPAPSPLPSPAVTPKRRSRVLEPLANLSPAGSSLS